MEGDHLSTFLYIALQKSSFGGIFLRPHIPWPHCPVLPTTFICCASERDRQFLPSILPLKIASHARYPRATNGGSLRRRSRRCLRSVRHHSHLVEAPLERTSHSPECCRRNCPGCHWRLPIAYGVWGCRVVVVRCCISSLLTSWKHALIPLTRRYKFMTRLVLPPHDNSTGTLKFLPLGNLAVSQRWGDFNRVTCGLGVCAHWSPCS